MVPHHGCVLIAGVDTVKEKTVLIVEVERGTNGFVPPIPFFQNRIRNMKRANLEGIRYHTDHFILQRVRPEQHLHPGEKLKGTAL